MRFGSSHAFALGLLSLGAACGGVSNEKTGEPSRENGGDSGSGGSGSPAGRGGVAAGGAGRGGGAAVGGAGLGAVGGGGSASGGSAANCGGPAPVQPGGVATTTFEGVQCYVSDPSVGGAACMPPDDLSLVAKLGDHINSIGFAVSFVIDSAETIPVPATCEPFVQCCESALSYRQQECYDWLDAASSAELVGGCPDHPRNGSPANPTEYFGCAGGSGAGGAPSDPGEGGAAGASDEPASRFLCCYRVCGFTRYL